MAKDPAFLFYPGDWLGGTMGMTFEEKGAYLELLVMQWHSHRITEAHAKRVVGNELWQKISHKFSKDDKGFFNKKLQDVIIERKKHSEKQKINANKRWNKHSCDGNAKAMPLESESEDINTDINKDYFGKSENLLKKEISETVLEATERNQFSHTGDRNTEFIKSQWEVFLSERANDNPIIQNQNKHRLGEYFINWMRTKFPKKINGKKVDTKKLREEIEKYGDKKISEE